MIFGISVALLVSALIEGSSGCTCAPTSQRSAFNNADIVAHVTVTSVRRTDNDFQYSIVYNETFKPHFNVPAGTHVPIPLPSRVQTPSSSAACGVPLLKLRGDYLIAGKRNGNSVLVSLCSGIPVSSTGIGSGAVEWENLSPTFIRRLRNGFEQNPGHPTPPHHPGHPSPPQHPGSPNHPQPPQHPSPPQHPGSPNHPAPPQHPGSPNHPSLPQHPGSPNQPVHPQNPGGPNQPAPQPQQPGGPNQPSAPQNPGGPNQPAPQPQQPGGPNQQNPGGPNQPAPQQPAPQRPNRPNPPAQPGSTNVSAPQN